MKKARPRINWGDLTRTTGTSKRLIDDTSVTPGARLTEGSQVSVAGLTVSIKSISLKGADVIITGRVVRKVRGR